MSNIGKQIMIRRKELGLTQEELARKMGYKSKSTINKIELGVNDIVQSKVVKFAEVLETTPAYLMGWDQEQIQAIDEILNDANAHEDEKEQVLQDFVYEIAKMSLDPKELKTIKEYAKMVKQTDNEFHKAMIEMFYDIYKLNLSIDDLNAIYTYAQMLKNNKKG